MSCYFIARISIHNDEEYGEYLKHVDEVFSQFNGRYLAVDENPETLEGDAEPGRVVLIEFPSEQELRRWYHSPEYQQILQHRLAAAECRAVIVKGL